MIVWDMECKAIRCHWSHDISGLHLQPPEDPAVFTVSQGSFATAPVPPQFAVDAAGGQWRRSNRGGRQGWSHGDLRLVIELICFLTCQRQIQTWCIVYSNLVWITPNRSMSSICQQNLGRFYFANVGGTSIMQASLLSLFQNRSASADGIGSARRYPWWIDVKLWTTFESLLGTWWQSRRCWGGGIYEAEYHGWKLTDSALNENLSIQICKDMQRSSMYRHFVESLKQLGSLGPWYRLAGSMTELGIWPTQRDRQRLVTVDSWQAWFVTSDSKRFQAMLFFFVRFFVKWWWKWCHFCPLTKNSVRWPVSLTGMGKVFSLHSDLQDWPGRNARSSLLSGTDMESFNFLKKQLMKTEPLLGIIKGLALALCRPVFWCIVWISLWQAEGHMSLTITYLNQATFLADMFPSSTTQDSLLEIPIVCSKQEIQSSLDQSES